MKIGKDFIHLWLIYLTSIAVFIILVFSFYTVYEIREITTGEARTVDENIYNKSASINKVCIAIHHLLSYRGSEQPDAIQRMKELSRAVIGYANLSVMPLDEKAIQKVVDDDPLFTLKRNRETQKQYSQKVIELASLYSEFEGAKNLSDTEAVFKRFQQQSEKMVGILESRNNLLSQIESHYHAYLRKNGHRLESYLTYYTVFFLSFTGLLLILVALYSRSRKKIMNELTQHRDILETRVKERTAIIT